MDKNEIYQRYTQEVNMGKSKSTQDLDKRILTVFCKYVNKDFKDITKDNVVAFFNAMYDGTIKTQYGKPFGAYTIEFYKTQLHKFFKWYTKEYQNKDAPEQTSWIKTNVRKAYKKKTLADILTQDELQRLIETTDNIRNKTIVAVLYDSACRLGELCGMTIGNIVKDHGDVLITVDGKTGQRTIPLNFSIKYLEDYLSGHPKRNNRNAPLWLSFYGKRFIPSNVQQMLYALREKAGLQKKLSPHIIRHSRLTELARQGMNESQMRYFAGWTTDSSMPAVYLHINGSDVRKTLQKIEPKQRTYTEREVNEFLEDRVRRLIGQALTAFAEKGHIVIHGKPYTIEEFSEQYQQHY